MRLMNEGSPTIFVSAAEASGDVHAARLIHALRQRLPEARFVGAGGRQMAQAGCEILADLTPRASMLAGPLLRLGYYYRTVGRLQRAIKKIRPDLHVPVDSPAMNWHLAAAAKKAGAKVVYYIAPQLWAWAPWRVKKLLRLADHVACILPFEQDYLRQRGVNATYVGHPLFDQLPPQPDPMPDLIQAWIEGNWRVVLLAGSRPAEIRGHTRALAETAAAIRKQWPRATCTVAAGGQEAASLLRKLLKGTNGEQTGALEIATGKTHEVLSRAHFAVAVSGTITLEAAHFGVPMVIFYRVGRLAYGLVGRWLIRTPHLSLVNILAGKATQVSSKSLSAKRIVPELMPWHGSSRQLASVVLEVMEDLGYLLETRQALLALAGPLRVPPPETASGKAADLIVDLLRDKG